MSINSSLENNRSLLIPCSIKSDVDRLELYTFSSFPSKAYYISHVIVSLVNVLLTCFTITLNTLTALAYWKSSQLKKKTCYFLVLLLSLRDLAIGVFSNPLYAAYLVAETLGHNNCVVLRILSPLTLWLMSLSFSTSIWLNFERYLGICHVFLHRNYVTKLRCVITCLSIWSVLTFQGGVYYLVNDNGIWGGLSLSIIVFCYILLLTFLYIKMFIQYRDTVGHVCHQKRLAQKRRLARSCIMVVGASSVCYLLAGIKDLLKPSVLNVFVIRTWSVTFVLANSSVNSLIFFWHNQILRNEAIKILQQTFKLKSS